MNERPVFVLDASALLALLHEEPGSDRVEMAFEAGTVVMSAMNYAEVVSKHARKGLDVRAFRENIGLMGLSVVPFDERSAESTGELKPRTREWGLSLADCACLSLSKRLGAAALTADLAWMNLKDEYNVELIRKGSKAT